MMQRINGNAGSQAKSINERKREKESKRPTKRMGRIENAANAINKVTPIQYEKQTKSVNIVPAKALAKKTKVKDLTVIPPPRTATPRLSEPAAVLRSDD